MIMKNLFTFSMVSLILVILSVVPAAAGSGDAEGSILKEVVLEKKPVNGSSIYQYKGDLSLFFGSSLDETFESSERDYGSRFSLIRVTGGSTKILFQSRGSMDSYFLRPSFFSADIDKAQLLILAETGTEYSWGARVFLVSPDGSAKDIGSLDVAVLDDPESDTVSVIPYTRIKVLGNGYEFTFSKDVIFNPGGLDDHPVSKERIKYIYNGSKLECIQAGK
jgi:hypothetical protein